MRHPYNSPQMIWTMTQAPALFCYPLVPDVAVMVFAPSVSYGPCNGGIVALTEEWLSSTKHAPPGNWNLDRDRTFTPHP